MKSILTVIDQPAGTGVSISKFGDSEYKNLNFGISRDPTQLDRNTLALASDVTLSQKKHARAYSNLPSNTKFDYSTPDYMHRYMAESAQKKTGFRQLLNINRDSLKELTKAETTLSQDNLSEEKVRAGVLRSNPRNQQISGAQEFQMHLTEHDFNEQDLVKIP